MVENSKRKEQLYNWGKMNSRKVIFYFFERRTPRDGAVAVICIFGIIVPWMHSPKDPIKTVFVVPACVTVQLWALMCLLGLNFQLNILD